MKVYINKEYSVQYTLELSKEQYEELKSDNFMGQLDQIEEYEYEQNISGDSPEIVNIEIYNNS